MKLASDQVVLHPQPHSFFPFQSSPELVDSILELLHMHVFRNIVYLCNDELDKVGTWFDRFDK